MKPSETVRNYCRQCNGLSQWNREIIKDCEGDKALCGTVPVLSVSAGKKNFGEGISKILSSMHGWRQTSRGRMYVFKMSYLSLPLWDKSGTPR